MYFFCLFRYDNRDGSHSHWSDDTVLRGRALFLAKHNPARLTIKNINYQDQSVYKCRVDFKMAPTSISSITLQVVGKLSQPTTKVVKMSGISVSFCCFITVTRTCQTLSSSISVSNSQKVKTITALELGQHNWGKK